MTSRRSIMLSLMLGAFLSVTGLNTAYAQVPRSISYQGLLIKANQPVTAQVNVKINVYNAAGQVLYTETMNQVQVNNGIFNVLLGGNAGNLPSNLKFDEQYYLGVDVDNTGEISPRTPFTAAPYALNAQTVGGVGVSVTPQPGMLLPLDANGKIPASVLPQATQAIDNINGVTGDVSGKLNLTGDGTITVTSNPATNTIKLGFAGGTGNGIKHIMTGPGLTGGGSDTTVEIHVADNGIVTNMIGTGVVTGMKLDQYVAGIGLGQDILGNLNINYNKTLTIVGSNLDTLGLNLANPNTWTGLQTFNGGITVGGTTTLVGPVIITGNTTQTGNYSLNGNFSVKGIAEPNALNGAAVANYEIIDTGDLRVLGFSYLNGNTDINGSIQNSSANNGGAVFIADPQGLTNSTGNITNTAGNIVNTLGNINNLAGNINNTGQINNTGALNEIGISTLNGNLIQGNGTGTTATFQNNSAIFNLTNSGTNGNSVIVNGTPEPNVGSAALVQNYDLTDNGDLRVTGTSNLIGNTFLNQTLTVAGVTTTNILTNTGAFTNTGTFTETGASTFNGTINQTGAANTVTFAGPTTINNTLNVTGLSTLTGVTNNGTLTQSGVITQTSLGVAPNNTLLSTNFTGNVLISGTLSNAGNATLGTGAGTTNTLGNAGSSTNTITGLNNQIIATNTNTITGLINNINGTTNINGNTQINGTLGTTGNVTLGTASTTNTFGAVGSANRFNGVSNFGSLPAGNGNKLIVDGIPNTLAPTAPTNLPPGFVQPTDYEQIINGDLLVTGFSNLRSATIGDLLVTNSFTLPASASFCANNIQVAQLSSWCGGAAGAAIAVNTAFNQNSLGTSAFNTFLGTNFTGNVAITGGLSSTGNTSLATLPGSSATLGNSTGATIVNGSTVTVNGPTTINGTTAHNGSITQTSGSAQFLNTQVNGTLGSTGNVTLGTASTTNTIGAAGATNTLTGLNNQLLATAANTLTAPQNNLNGVLNQTGSSNFTGGTTTFTNNPVVLNNSNINGSNNSNISNVTTVQANVSMTIGVGTQATTLTSTNTTGAAINQQLASVGGKIPVYLRQISQFTGVGGGPNGGAVTPVINFGANGFDNNDAITVTYYTRNGAQFGQMYPVNINAVAGTLQVESTNPLDVNTVQVVILRD